MKNSVWFEKETEVYVNDNCYFVQFEGHYYPEEQDDCREYTKILVMNEDGTLLDKDDFNYPYVIDEIMELDVEPNLEIEGLDNYNCLDCYD